IGEERIWRMTSLRPPELLSIELTNFSGASAGVNARPVGLPGHDAVVMFAADWETVAVIATAVGTLVLAVATFSAVRSSNRSARIAERALLAGMRPLLVPSLRGDPDQKLLWRDRHVVKLGGGRAVAEEVDGVIYLAVGLRNVGTGLALLHGWYPRPHF